MTTSTVQSWCRACGSETEPVAACTRCGSPADGPTSEPTSSRVGLVFEYRRRLRPTKQGICIEDDGSELTLHISEKESIKAPAAELGLPLEIVPHTLSVAGRLVMASSKSRSIGADWSSARLLALVKDATSNDYGARRALANEALREGWTEVFDQCGLSVSERAWLQAHEAAAHGRLDDLRRALESIPYDAYAAKTQLLLPYLPQIAATPSGWLPLLERWRAAGVPQADELLVLLDPDWRVSLPAVVARLDVSPSTSGHLNEALLELTAGRVPRPPAGASASWTAAALYQDGCAGSNVDAALGSLTALSTALLDDLVDAGALTASAPLRGAVSPAREHLLARLAPQGLDDATLSLLGHHAERARRRFLLRDANGLRGLPDEPAVLHYRALLDVVADKRPDPDALREEVGAILAVVETAKEALAGGRANRPPDVILRDPTLWIAFAGAARSGALTLSQDDRSDHPRFAEWCDLQRLLGLAWESRWEEASALGVALADVSTNERVQDEALNLAAFALHQLDRDVEGLRLVQRALAGNYTDSLLVNASILAAATDPATAMNVLAKLVEEAPSPQLRTAALRRALHVWGGLDEGTPLPSSLHGPLTQALRAPGELDDYILFLDVACTELEQLVLQLPRPQGAHAGVLELAQARVRLRTDADFGAAQLAQSFIGVYRQHGRTPWFDARWGPAVAAFRDGIFVPFGEALGSALFFDAVAVQAPELLTPFDRLILVPQAGAHISVHLETTNDWLSDDALVKFFFKPADELAATVGVFPDDVLHHLSENLGKCMAVSSLALTSASRDLLADRYNALVERLRWDYSNSYAIRSQMATVLEDCGECVSRLEMMIDRLHRLALPHAEKADWLEALVGPTRAWRDEIIQLRSQL